MKNLPKHVTILNLILLISSLVFYYQDEKKYFWVMFLIGAIDYSVALIISYLQKTNARKIWTRLWLLLSIISNMGILFYFKYIGFTLGLFNDLAVLSNTQPLNFSVTRDIIMPLGISFYTFESLSYVIDVFRGQTKATRKLIDYWTFITFFPHLIAGPIIRFSQLQRQLESREHNWENIAEGFRRFFFGLGKKVILANPLAYYTDLFYNLDPTRIDATLSWLMTCTFALQLYFDFSAYSDMAIGLGRLFGIKLPENFNYPYIASSMTDGWRRWHITLTGWFRDYVYKPLCHVNSSHSGRVFNVIFVFMLCGLWHGANLTFIYWGLINGVFLGLEVALRKKKLRALPTLFGHLYFITVILISLVFFRSSTLDQALKTVFAMFGGNSLIVSEDTLKTLLEPHFLFYFLSGIICSTPFYINLARHVSAKLPITQILFNEIIPLAIFFISVVMMTEQTYVPFIYFRF
ncbi:MAG: MBOAT family protein [Bdellovibrionales bacterium]|nr:MBOAT family protein [Bdellovibrionales bacterium]